MNFLLFLAPLLLIFILGNYGINEYYKTKNTKLKNSLNKDSILKFEKIFGELNANAKYSYNYYKILTDIIVTNEHIYLLPKIYNLSGKIALNQPSIQINLNKSDHYRNQNCSRFLEFTNYIVIKNSMRISANDLTIKSGKYRISLDFNSKEHINQIIEKLNSHYS